MRSAAILLALLLGFVAGAQAGAVSDWNALGLRYVRAAKTSPPVASRAMAVLHAAIFDAANSISPEFQAYLVPGSAPAGASLNAAVAAAARDVLNALYPAFTAQTNSTFDAKLVQSLDPADAEDLGAQWGAQVAATVLALRSDDGSRDVVSARPPGVYGDWWVV